MVLRPFVGGLPVGFLVKKTGIFGAVCKKSINFAVTKQRAASSLAVMA